jgi:hypothetical protein
MASHYERLILVISRHLDRSASTRVPHAVYEAADAALEARGWTMWQLLHACITVAARRPGELLALVAESKPARKPQGRPRKATPPHDPPA